MKIQDLNMLRNRYLWVIAILLAIPLNAKEIPSGTSLAQMNTRTFDFRTDVQKMRKGEDAFVLTRSEWLLKVIKKDPYLGQHDNPDTLYTIVEIQVRPDPIRTFWPPAAHFSRYVLTDNIPEKFIVDGFQTFSSHPSNRSLLLLPIGNPYDFFVTCSGVNTEERAYCVVEATYPPDPNIRLRADIVVVTKPPFHFREIAHRMREIAYCLDVTDRLDKDGRSPEKPVDPDGELPVLDDCYVEPTS